MPSSTHEPMCDEPDVANARLGADSITMSVVMFGVAPLITGTSFAVFGLASGMSKVQVLDRSGSFHEWWANRVARRRPRRAEFAIAVEPVFLVAMLQPRPAPRGQQRGAVAAPLPVGAAIAMGLVAIGWVGAAMPAAVAVRGRSPSLTDHRAR